MIESLLTESQVASLLGVKPVTLALWRKNGIGPRFVKLNRLVRYKREDVGDYIDSNRQ